MGVEACNEEPKVANNGCSEMSAVPHPPCHRLAWGHIGARVELGCWCVRHPVESLNGNLDLFGVLSDCLCKVVCIVIIGSRWSGR
jgi:hypothetical protein